MPANLSGGKNNIDRLNKIGLWDVRISHNRIDKRLVQNLYTCTQCGYKYKNYPNRPVKTECPACSTVMTRQKELVSMKHENYTGKIKD